MASDRSPEPKPDTSKKDAPRRSWQTPKLVEYGHIGKLTQGPSGAKAESATRKR